MIWVILTFVFGWLLCGAWALRMDEKDGMNVKGNAFWFYYIGGLLGLTVVWLGIWPERIWKFGKGVVNAWKQGMKVENGEAKKKV